jgi:hypothetical protein
LERLATYLLTRAARKKNSVFPGTALRQEGILNPRRLDTVEKREVVGLFEPKIRDRRHSKGHAYHER